MSLHGKLDVKIFLMFIVAENTGSVDIVLWKTADQRVNLEKRFAHYEIYTWTLCNSYLHEKQTSRIQSLNEKQTSKIQSLCLFFIKIVPFVFCFFAMKYQFLIHNRAVYRTATGTAVSYVTKLTRGPFVSSIIFTSRIRFFDIEKLIFDIKN